MGMVSPVNPGKLRRMVGMGLTIFFLKRMVCLYCGRARRGRGGQSTVPATLTATPQDQLWFNNFRMGQNNTLYDNVTFPKGEDALDQFYKQMVPDTGKFDVDVVADAMDALFDKMGDGILVTHSAGGGPGWTTAMRNPHVKGVISLEPGTFPFPKHEAPETEVTTSPFPAAPTVVSDEDFEELRKFLSLYTLEIIFLLVQPGGKLGQDNWRVRLNLAHKWADVVNAHGGDVTIISLPDEGIKGNTHFMMADLITGM